MLSYCEICGVLIPGGAGGSTPEGVICDECYSSRQVVLGDESSDEVTAVPADAGHLQFDCIYCRSLLRLPSVPSRTSVRCPQCAEQFFLCPDGRVEARLEGNTTAILAKDETLRDLMHPAGDDPQTQVLGKTHAKTQPISPVSPTQKAALRDLASKNLDVVRSLPPRDLLPVDAKRHRLGVEQDEADESAAYDLLPEEIGPGEVDETAVTLTPHDPSLRASDEGRIDLDLDRLRQRTKTRRLKDRGKGLAERKKKKKPDPEELERRQRRQAEAARKAQELERSKARASTRSSLLAAAVLLPALLALLLLSMTVRGTGFATRGAVGDGLRDLGSQASVGLRELNALLPAGLSHPTLGK